MTQPRTPLHPGPGPRNQHARSHSPVPRNRRNNNTRPATTKGRNKAPTGYCRRCWKADTVREHNPNTPGRCNRHHQEIEKELREEDARANRKKDRHAARHEPRLNAGTAINIALAWLARETGAGREDSSHTLSTQVLDAFWDSIPDSNTLAQSQVNKAYNAATQAYEALTGLTYQPTPCPKCQDQNAQSRQGNDFTCQACGWSAPKGSFSDIYLEIAAPLRPSQST